MGEVTTLTMAELTKRVAQTVGESRAEAGLPKLKRAEVAEIVEAVFTTIEGAISNHEKIAIQGYLKGDAKFVPARTRRNPRTGETVEKEAGYKLVLKAGSKLVAAV